MKNSHIVTSDFDYYNPKRWEMKDLKFALIITIGLILTLIEFCQLAEMHKVVLILGGGE